MLIVNTLIGRVEAGGKFSGEIDLNHIAFPTQAKVFAGGGVAPAKH